MNKPHFDALMLELIRTKVCPQDLSDAELNALRASLVALGTKVQYLKTDKLRALLEDGQ